MQSDDEFERLGYGGGVASRPKGFMAKTAAIVVGGTLLAGALVVSLAFFVFSLIFVLVGGGYLWWRTRHLRRHMREQFHRQSQAQGAPVSRSSDDVIEGVVVSRGESRD